MNAQQLQAEQDFINTLRSYAETATRIQNERDKYRDALAKIQATRFLGLTFEQKTDRMIEIAERTLET